MTAPAIISQDTPHGPRWAYGTLGFISFDGAPGTGGEPLRNALTVLQERHTDALANLLPERVPEHLQRTVGSMVYTATGEVLALATGEARAAREADLRWLEPARPVELALAADTWNAYRAMDDAGRTWALDSADLTDLTALVAHGNRVPLVDTIWNRAVERYREENWLVVQNLAAQHPATATIERPLAIGADMDAARDEVRDLLAQHRARLEAVETNEKSVRDLLVFLGAVLGMTPGAVLDAALGRDHA